MYVTALTCLSMRSALIQWSDWLAKLNFPALTALFLLLTFLIKYQHDVHVRAGDLLLKLEDAFSKFGSKLRFLEYMERGYTPVRHIFLQCILNPDLISDEDRKTLEDVDDCIRFLFICSLHAGATICPSKPSWWKRQWQRRFFYPSLVPQAYYYYLNRLNDEQNRPELYRYVKEFFPTLKLWLDRNKEALNSYRGNP